jgi:TonB family protein
MPSLILVLLFARMAIAQVRPASPPVTPRSSLPITRGVVTFVDPGSPCPPYKGGPVRVGGDLAQPPLLQYTPPRRAPSTGRVLVEATIQPDGTVRKVRVLRGPRDLHELALGAVRQWTFARTCLNGTAIPIIHVVVVTFSGN